mgnify:CR=1 FL=1
MTRMIKHVILEMEMMEMELKDVLLKRRSVRRFKEEKVSREMINELMHAAMSGPSACNKRPWKFFVITNEEKLIELKNASRFSKMDAPLAIVVCGDLSRRLPKALASYWIQDCSAATENILLRVTDLGLGAVWCGLHPQKSAEDKVKEFLKLNDELIPLSLIWIGYPNEEPEARDQYEEECIVYVD